MRLGFFAHALTATVFGLTAFGGASATGLPHSGTIMTIENQQYGVYIENDVNERVPSFNEGIRLHGLSGHVTTCSLLIDLPVGVVGGNHSYGGYCKLVDPKGTKSLIRVCNDEMVGHFGLETANPSDDWSEAALARFVVDHCFGG